MIAVFLLKVGKAVLTPSHGDNAIATSEAALRHETAETRGCASNEPCPAHHDFLSVRPHQSNSLFPCRDVSVGRISDVFEYLS
jgi:hypothetical protein